MSDTAPLSRTPTVVRLRLRGPDAEPRACTGAPGSSPGQAPSSDERLPVLVCVALGIALGTVICLVLALAGVTP